MPHAFMSQVETAESAGTESRILRLAVNLGSIPGTNLKAGTLGFEDVPPREEMFLEVDLNKVCYSLTVLRFCAGVHVCMGVRAMSLCVRETQKERGRRELGI